MPSPCSRTHTIYLLEGGLEDLVPPTFCKDIPANVAALLSCDFYLEFKLIIMIMEHFRTDRTEPLSYSQPYSYQIARTLLKVQVKLDALPGFKLNVKYRTCIGASMEIGHMFRPGKLKNIATVWKREWEHEVQSYPSASSFQCLVAVCEMIQAAESYSEELTGFRQYFIILTTLWDDEDGWLA